MVDDSGIGPASVPSEGEAGRASAIILAGLFGGSVVVADRYELGNEIGRGGLGVVHRARDLRLDREVALKFPTGASTNPDIVANVEREAKVLARLHHPNIVAVYDVGHSDRGVYLAMELVEGVPMSTWLRERKPDWQAVLERMRQAAAGLAAAHEAGVVHRDFKPANVMIDEQGRVRVVDFGLAREVSAVVDTPNDGAGSYETKAAGTPPYMAPEQFDGHVSAASDQFAFCTALFEGVCGRRPWRTRERGVATKQDRERLSRVLRNGGAPRWVRRVILRGLATEPEDRFASMAALRSALGRQPRGWIFGFGGLGAAAAVALGVRSLAAQPCPTPTRMDETWTPQARARVAEKLPDASALEAIDEATAGWTEVATQSCEAHAAGELSPLTYELRQRCLDRVGQGFEYALDQVVSETVPFGRISNALLRAIDVKGCSDDEELLLFGRAGAGQEVDLELSDEIDRAIARAYVQLNLGKPAAFFEILENIYRTHGPRDDTGMSGARLAFQYGTALARRGAFEEAEAVMREGVLKYAADPRAHAFIAELRGGLAVALSADPQRALEAKHLAEDAITMFGRDGPSSLQVPALTAHARASAVLGDVDAAEASLEKISAIIEKYEREGWGGYDRNLDELQVISAEVRSRLGQTEAAERSYAQAIARLRERGTKPGVLARALNNLAELRGERDSSPQTAAYAEEAAALKDAIGDRVGAATSMMVAGTIHLRAGRDVDAARAYEQGLAMLPDDAHERRAEIALNLGLAHQSAGSQDRARAALLEARDASGEAGLQESELRYGVEVTLLQLAVAQQDDAGGRRALRAVRRFERPSFSAYTRAEVEIAACELDRLRDPEAARRAADRAAVLVDEADDAGLRKALAVCRERVG